MFGRKADTIIFDEIVLEEQRFYSDEHFINKTNVRRCPRCSVPVHDCEVVCPDCWEYWFDGEEL
jgi:hypothetical protein